MSITLSDTFEFTKPCPFCGEVQQIKLCVEDEHSENWLKIYCTCLNCGSCGPDCFQDEPNFPMNDAVELWNMRDGNG